MKITLDTEKKTVTLLENISLQEITNFMVETFKGLEEWTLVLAEPLPYFQHYWCPHCTPQYYPFEYTFDTGKEYYTTPPITCENKADERDQAIKNSSMTLEEMRMAIRDTPITFGKYFTDIDPIMHEFPKEMLWDRDKLIEELANQEGKCWTTLTKENVDNLLKEYKPECKIVEISLSENDKKVIKDYKELVTKKSNAIGSWIENEELRLAKEMSKDDPVDTDAMHYKEKFLDPNAIKASLVRMRRRKIVKPKK